MSSRRRDFDAALERADRYIQKQIYKLEQKKARQDAAMGRGYGQISSGREQAYRSPAPPIHSRPPPQGPVAPAGWRQDIDPQSQRCYYVEQATGCSQWDPPGFSQGPCTQPFSRSQRADTISDEQLAKRLQEEEDARARQRSRAYSQPPGPSSSSQFLGVKRPDAQRQVASVSPHPSPHGRLPPGSHLDLRTGQIVTNMYPRSTP